ncbi:hypothetical protein JTB14_037850 [Gonioctena quinquepunctata]|nr:hypothetical protein JTB14_037850 [Gonioctena quinquepunctata]
MNSSRGILIAAMARDDSKNPAAKFGYLNSSRGKIIVKSARNELKEPTSKSDASGAEENCLTFDFPECNAVELNYYNNGSSSSKPQIITNLETVLISSIPHIADLSEQRNNTDLPEQLVLLNIFKKKFDSFKQQFPSFIGSNDLYRKILKQENICFVKLGHEECEDCEYYLLHNEDNLAPDCAICQKWDEHIKKADKSRTRYKEYAGRKPVEGEIEFSVDLEKVIMLPRCDIFTEDYRIQ